MMTALDSLYNGGNVGALGAMVGKAKAEQAAERAESLAKQSEDDKVEAKLRGVAEDFVSVFMNQVMKSMRATVQENPKMHGDNGEKFFQEMLDEEYSKSLSSGAGYGLTDLVYQSLLGKHRMSEANGQNEIPQDSLNDQLVLEESQAPATVEL